MFSFQQKFNYGLKVVVVVLLIGIFFMSGVRCLNAANVESSVLIPVGEYKLGRLKNIPANSQVDIGIVVNGKVMAFLLDEEQLKSFPKVKNAYLIANVYHQLVSRIFIENEGNYYLVLLNNDNPVPITVKFAINANSTSPTQLNEKQQY